MTIAGGLYPPLKGSMNELGVVTLRTEHGPCGDLATNPKTVPENTGF